MYASCIILHILAVCLVLTNSFQRQVCKMSLKSGESVLIVQNKGGGHGSIGYHLSKEILNQYKDVKVILLQDKASSSKEPFKSYDELKQLGVSIIESKLSGPDSSIEIPSELNDYKVDFIVDNWSKTPENSTFSINIAKKYDSKQLIFISSAGMYQSSGVQPLVETDPVKSSNGARKIELEIEKSGVPFTFLRPQYLYGKKASKRYLDFFIGRACRKLPVPVPLHGDQLVCLTNLVDLASLVTTCIGHEKALHEIFNAGTDRYVSYKGLISSIFSAANEILGVTDNDAKTLSYNPSKFEDWDGKLDVSEFPFRKETFITSVDKIKTLLDWAPKSNLIEDFKAEVSEYISSERVKEDWGFPQLQYDLEAQASKDPKKLLSYDFFKSHATEEAVDALSFESALELIKKAANSK